MGRKYARIFVLGHNLLFVAHSFPRASLSENCSLLGTDNVRGQISVHIFAPNGDYCLYISVPVGGYCLFSNLLVVIILSIKTRSSIYGNAALWLHKSFDCSVRETMEHYNYKEGYLMVWANYISPCNSIAGLYSEGTCDSISVTMRTRKFHKNVNYKISVFENYLKN